MANPYDQFDPKPEAATPKPEAGPQSGPNVSIRSLKGANPYDEFDAAAAGIPAATGPEMSLPEHAADFVKSGGVGLAKGTIGVAGMPGDARVLADKASEGLVSHIGKWLGVDPAKMEEITAGYHAGLEANPSRRFPTSDEMQKGVEQVTGEFRKPQGPAGEYGETIGKFIPGAALGPGGVTGNVIKYGVLPAVASETVGQIAKGQEIEPYARAFTALATGGIAAFLSRPGSAEHALANSLPEFVTDQHLRQAKSLIDQAANNANPVKLTWDEALSQVTGRPVLQETRRILESAPQSREKMQAFTADRPAEIGARARGEFDNLASRPADPHMTGPQVGTAAEGAVNDTRKGINAITDADYKASSAVLLTGSEMRQVMAIPGYREARDAVRNNVQLNRHVANLPDHSVGFLNEVKKQMDATAKGAGSPLTTNPNMQIPAGWSADAENLRNTLTRKSRDYATAVLDQADMRTRFLDPILKGPLGALADKDIKTKEAITALFPKSPIAGGEDQITRAVSAVARRNPEAATQLVRAHAEAAFNDAARSLTSEGNQFVGAKFSIAITGNPQQRANLKAAVEALPNGNARWDGFNRFLEVVEATGHRMPIGSKTTFNTAELERLSTLGGAAGTAQTMLKPESFFTAFDRELKQWKLGNNLNRMADILTDPNSVAILRTIKDLPSGSQRAQALAFRLIAQQNAPATQREPTLTDNEQR